jgi:hypothetical protein
MFPAAGSSRSGTETSDPTKNRDFTDFRLATLVSNVEVERGNCFYFLIKVSSGQFMLKGKRKVGRID